MLNENQSIILKIQDLGVAEYTVELRLDLLFPDLNNRVDPDVEEYLKNMHAYDMYYSDILLKEEDKVLEITNQLDVMYASVVGYFIQAPSAVLAVQAGFPSGSSKPPTESYIKKCIPFLKETYGGSGTGFDDTGRLIFSGSTYRSLQRALANAERNVRILKTVLRNRREFQNNVRALNTNNRSQKQFG